MVTRDNLSTTYNPQAIEKKWHAYWQENKLFKTEIKAEQEPFSLVIPPPNVTGSLHMGHALNNTLQDIIVRWRRMSGWNTLWLPGTDHGGIATQNVVEKELAKEGLSRHDLGREKFVERVWAWKEEYGSTIMEQLKKLGASPDFSRERFTMDPGCSQAVREAFVRLYEKGLIYRGHYLINWCSRCQTALSDIEVEHLDSAGKLYYIKYPLEQGTESIVIATTRPETMLGDVAVAVNPQDERYSHLIGMNLILPLVGRKIPLIADEYVDKEFGTGAVKITPAHDPNDFLLGQRHNLAQIKVMNNDATMKEAGRYTGLDRYECRKQVVKGLEEQGFLVKVEDHSYALGHCSRCDTVVEPLLSEQWFVKMQPLAEPAIKVVQEGKIRFIPERFSKTYLDWLENIKDWCISRQIWWGHRIPVWYCSFCGEMIVAVDTPDQCPRCSASSLKQDPDVLDTWFSSALWPFSTLGWPEDTPDLQRFYPTSVLVTGYDIIYFWVARMIFMGWEFMGEIPFQEVLINGIIRDQHGKKMSKSRGNTVDPLEIIEKFGADTLRFTLISASVPGNDMRLHEERFEATRNFCNKIWNASRFTLMNLTDFSPKKFQEEELNYSLADRWIISRYYRMLEEVNRGMEGYDFSAAAKTIYEFLWNEFCDWYIELAKPQLYQKEDPVGRQRIQQVLATVLSDTLKILHPFMPYLTEEIWQNLPHEGKSIMSSSWPLAGKIDEAAEKEMGLVMELVRAIRNIRGEVNLTPGKKIEVIIQAQPAELAIITKSQAYLTNLAGIAQLQLTALQEEKPEKAMTARVEKVELYLPLAGLLDLDKERERLEKELALAEKEVERVDNKLNNPGFTGKAPAEIIAKEQEKREEWLEKKDKILERLAIFTEI